MTVEFIEIFFFIRYRLFPNTIARRVDFEKIHNSTSVEFGWILRNYTYRGKYNLQRVVEAYLTGNIYLILIVIFNHKRYFNNNKTTTGC